MSKSGGCEQIVRLCITYLDQKNALLYIISMEEIPRIEGQYRG